MEHTGLLFLFTCQPTKSSNFSRSGVNVRAHLLRLFFIYLYKMRLNMLNKSYILLYNECRAFRPRMLRPRTFHPDISITHISATENVKVDVSAKSINCG